MSIKNKLSEFFNSKTAKGQKHLGVVSGVAAALATAGVIAGAIDPVLGIGFEMFIAGTAVQGALDTGKHFTKADDLKKGRQSTLSNLFNSRAAKGVKLLAQTAVFAGAGLYAGLAATLVTTAVVVTGAAALVTAGVIANKRKKKNGGPQAQAPKGP